MAPGEGHHRTRGGNTRLQEPVVDGRSERTALDPSAAGRCGSIALANSIKNFRAVLWASADKSIYGQESNPTTWRLAGMNLAIRGFNANLGQEPADTLARDQFPDQSSNHAWLLWGCRRNWMRRLPVIWCGWGLISHDDGA